MACFIIHGASYRNDNITLTSNLTSKCLLDSEKYPCLYSALYVHRCFQKSTPLQFVMSHMHENHNLELYFIERTYFLNLWLPKFELHHISYQLVHGHILTREILHWPTG